MDELTFDNDLPWVFLIIAMLTVGWNEEVDNNGENLGGEQNKKEGI